MSSVRMQLEQLDAKMAELQQMYDPQEFNTEPIDLELEDFPVVVDDDLPFDLDEKPLVKDELVEDSVLVMEEPVEESVEEEIEEIAEEEPVLEPEPVVEDAPEEVEEPVVEEVVESVVEEVEEEVEEEEPLFMAFEQVQKHVEKARPAAVIDVMATKHAWRNDMPGTPVKDIRAAIALVDRAWFINSLFAEDAMSFLEALNHINQATSLDEVVEYLAATHPEWDFDSDVVYRFMMAVRRKIN